MVESCGIALFKKMVVHSNSKVASSAEVKRLHEETLGGSAWWVFAHLSGVL